MRLEIKAYSKTAGIGLVIIASVLWSLSGIFTQLPQLNLWPKESRGFAISFWRALFALTFLLPMVRKISWHWGMIPMVTCFVIMNVSFLTSIVSGIPANTIWLQYLAPAWVMLGAVFLYGDKTQKKDWWMLCCCTAGVLFILLMESLHSSGENSGGFLSPLLAILSGITYAGVILSMRLLPNEDKAWLIALNHIATAIVVFPILLWNGSPIPNGSLWFVLAALGIFQMGLPYFLFVHALKTTPSHIAALITLLEPVILPLWVHLVRSGDSTYHPPGWWTWVGAAMILVGLVSSYIELPLRKKKEESCE